MELETQSFIVPVSIRGMETTMSLTRQGEIWILDGNGLGATAKTSGDVFVTALGIIDGKKAAKKWDESNDIEGGEGNGRKIG